MLIAAHTTKAIPPLTMAILCVLGAILVITAIVDLRHRAANARREAAENPATHPAPIHRRIWVGWLWIIFLSGAAAYFFWRSNS